MANLRAWIVAFRLRTLPLALSCILMGSFLAAYDGTINPTVLVLSLITTLLLQILSNLANDYGDASSGVDNTDRAGPRRMVQAGVISGDAMKRAIIIVAVLAFLSGSLMLWAAFGTNWSLLLVFLLIGIGAIVAAVKYTIGQNPYGYIGFGDLFVFIFFGFVGVFGSYFLHIRQFNLDVLLPAASCGFLSVGVLNVNNIRDMASDSAAGKRSIPVRIGAKWGKIYHAILLFGAIITALSFGLIRFNDPRAFAFMIIVVPIVLHLRLLWKKEGVWLDPLLRQLAIFTLLFVLLFGFSLWIDQ